MQSQRRMAATGFGPQAGGSIHELEETRVAKGPRAGCRSMRPGGTRPRDQRQRVRVAHSRSGQASRRPSKGWICTARWAESSGADRRDFLRRSTGDLGFARESRTRVGDTTKPA